MKSVSARHSAAKATLRQLAVLGLPGVMLHETVASVMRRLVACDLVAFQELDSAGNLAGAWINYPEMMPELSVYLERFHNSLESEAHITFDEFFRRGVEQDMMHRGTGDYLRSALYNELYRSIDFRYIVRTALREGDQARGCIMVSRGHHGQDFTGESLRLLREAAPYLTHAFSAPPKILSDENTVETAEGQLICDGTGKVEYVSPQGRRLLHDLAEVPMTAATLSDHCLSWARPHLQRLIGEAAKLAEGRPGGVPALTRDTVRGRYVMRVWRLAAAPNNSSAPWFYSVSIRRYIPLVLRLLESETVIGLPAREKSICLMLAEGLESKEIAARLDLSLNTVISYIRSLYSRLGITGRHELLTRLTAPDG
jgi:DNA-binding CsgD family transcriptional regulator